MQWAPSGPGRQRGPWVAAPPLPGPATAAGTGSSQQRPPHPARSTGHHWRSGPPVMRGRVCGVSVRAAGTGSSQQRPPHPARSTGHHWRSGPHRGVRVRERKCVVCCVRVCVCVRAPGRKPPSFALLPSPPSLTPPLLTFKPIRSPTSAGWLLHREASSSRHSSSSPSASSSTALRP